MLTESAVDKCQFDVSVKTHSMEVSWLGFFSKRISLLKSVKVSEIWNVMLRRFVRQWASDNMTEWLPQWVYDSVDPIMLYFSRCLFKGNFSADVCLKVTFPFAHTSHLLVFSGAHLACDCCLNSAKLPNGLVRGSILAQWIAQCMGISATTWVTPTPSMPRNCRPAA